MPSSQTNYLNSPEPLASAVAAARETCAAAHRWRAHVLMVDTARLVRQVFPTAASLVIDAEHRYVWPDGVLLAAVLDAEDAVLWSTNNPRPDPAGWSPLRQRIEENLTEALGADATDAVWPNCNQLAASIGHTPPDVDLYRAALPTEEEVAALQPAERPDRETRRRARYYNRGTRHLPATSDTELPAIRIAGAVVFAYVDPTRPHPTLCVSVDLDEVVPEVQTLPDQAVALHIRVQGTPVYLAPHTSART